MSIAVSENGYFVAAEIGTTTLFIKKYTAAHRTPDKTA